MNTKPKVLERRLLEVGSRPALQKDPNISIEIKTINVKTYLDPMQRALRM